MITSSRSSTPSGRYPVLVGPGCARELAGVLPASARRVAVVTQAGIGLAVDPGREHRVTTIPDGEAAKTLATVEDLCREWARWGLTRADAVVAVGGGLVTDVAGFAAASYHRGVPGRARAHDAARHGRRRRRRQDRREPARGQEPRRRVLAADARCSATLDALATLPPRELRSGQGELAKYHFLTDVDLLELDLEERIAAAVRIKAAVVAADEREDPSDRRGRATLNYGHTLAHALEIETGARRCATARRSPSGSAYAAALAQRLGRIGEARVAEHRPRAGRLRARRLAAGGRRPRSPARR